MNAQSNQIIRYCEANGSITVREAFEVLKINSPTKRISEIRQSNNYTVSTIEESKTDAEGNTKRWRRYFIHKKSSETLCWLCKNSCGGCSWSSKFIPVEGWEAIPTKINIQDGESIDSFHVIRCPEYEGVK